MRLAMAGNVIDFGASHKFNDETIHTGIKKILLLKEINSELLKEEVNKAKSILYIGDNAGEIVFDNLFIEQFPLEKVTFAVCGKAILSDAVMEDAEVIGLTDLVPVISNGTVEQYYAIVQMNFKKYFMKPI